MTVLMHEKYYVSEDGLRLYYRDYRCAGAKLPVICLPGLTRNSRDFEDLAPLVAAERRVLSPDFRGRGYSARDRRWENYQPPTYAADTWLLMRENGLANVILCGTSLGGLVSMLMTSQQPERIAGVILNDIGPEIDPRGLARISQYTGRLAAVDSWAAASAQAREIYGAAWPGLAEDYWARIARRGYREIAPGEPELDMDPGIGRAIREGGIDLGDPWELYAALGPVPTLVLRGAHSDILAAATVEKMQAKKPDLQVAEIPNRGHVPLLDEPESVRAIVGFLSQLP